MAFFNTEFGYLPAGSELTLDSFLDYKGDQAELSNRDLISMFRVDMTQDVNPTTEVSANVFLYFSSEFGQRVILRDEANIEVDSDDLYPKIQEDLHHTESNFNLSSFANYFQKKASVNVLYYSNILGEWLMFYNITELTTTMNDLGASFSISLSLDSITLFGEAPPSAALRSGVDDDRYVKGLGINDLVYISYFPLIQEETSTVGDVIKGNRWACIGLVDSINKTYNSLSNDLSYSISGRDLVKLFIEDGSYYYPLAYAGGARMNLSNQDRKEGAIFSRSQTSGDIESFLRVSNGFTLGEGFSFIIETLSTTNLIVEDDNNNLKSIYPLKNQTREERGFYQGVWRIFKLAIDNSVHERRVVDFTLQQEQGSILKTMQKYIVDPFAEMIFDTYGHNYYCIVREPPFTKAGVMLNLSSTTTSADIASLPHREIDAAYILNLSLTFNTDADIYSWYRVTPKALSYGSQDILARIPTVYFREYVDRWGSKPYDKVHNYLELRGDDSIDQESDTRNYFTEGIADLAKVIEMYQYLPFVRKGSITLSLIDTGIRKGSFVSILNEFKQRELFYVDGVTWQYDENEEVEERTVIQVSRGMVIDYIDGMTVDGQLMSYFNIIDLSGVIPDGTADIPWQVNKPVFDFFYYRRQFA